VACQTEIQHLNVSVVAHHDVFRFDITVDDIVGVRRGQGLCDLSPDLYDPGDRLWSSDDSP
jgi:hypothetical protein